MRASKQLLDIQNDVARGQREAREQVEKLYWQNINRVKLRGGGDANYTLIKDDLGNWVVKAYSSDPGVIIKSAQSLALFAHGARIDTNLLRRLDLERVADSDADPAKRKEAQDQLREMGPEVNVGLERVRAAAAERHLRDLQLTAVKIKATLAQTPDEVAQALGAMPGADVAVITEVSRGLVAPHLQSASTQLTAAIELPPQDAQRRDRLTTAQLGAVKALYAFGVNLARALNERAPATPAAAPTVGAASAPAAAAPAASSAAEHRAVVNKARNLVLERVEAAGKTVTAPLATFDAGLAVVGEAQTMR